MEVRYMLFGRGGGERCVDACEMTREAASCRVAWAALWVVCTAVYVEMAACKALHDAV